MMLMLKIRRDLEDPRRSVEKALLLMVRRAKVKMETVNKQKEKINPVLVLYLRANYNIT
jgi:hypothetical protein